MKSINYLGDNRLKHRIVYSKQEYTRCIYCGEAANTREHIPSKVFLEKPYPSNLYIVPACIDCNNSFSADELFLSIFISWKKHKYTMNKHNVDIDLSEKLKKHNETLKKIIRLLILDKNEEVKQKVEKILYKLAIGHAVYELSEGFFRDSQNFETSIKYTFLEEMTPHEVNDFTTPFILNDYPLPEIGSRVYERIMVVEYKQDYLHKLRMLMLDWVDVQDDIYTYTAYIFGSTIKVKMVFLNYFFAEIHIKIS
ncbi:hypothetical protein ACQCT6_02900 [Cytobacillus gottheilii]|uniref:hypothetical protein n=1 Tax=Cytobacillus gottheilii TaxID=859144 RepID=UPI003CEBDFB2